MYITCTLHHITSHITCLPAEIETAALPDVRGAELGRERLDLIPHGVAWCRGQFVIIVMLHHVTSPLLARWCDMV